MRKLQIEELGHYLPSFFYLKVNTDKSLDNLSELDQDTLSTFIHEYIHFLQDILTVFGVRYIVYIVDLLKTISTSIHENKSNIIDIPATIPFDSVAITNKDLVLVYMGDSECKDEFDKVIQVIEETNDFIKGYEHVKYVEVQALDSKTGKETSFHFGTICIQESMAYLLESEFFNNVNPPKIPYRSVELVCSYFLPEIGNNKELLIALCDVSLSTTDPAHIFIDILKRLRDNKENIPKSAQNIYEVAAGYKFGSIGKQKGMLELYEKFNLDAEKSLKDYFGSTHFQPLIDWITQTFKMARKIRTEEGFTFAQLISDDKNKGMRMIRDHISKLGTPLMANNANQYWAYHPNSNSENFAILFKAINQVFNVLFGNQINCELKAHCSKLKDSNVCSYCDTSPWKLASNNDSLCAFAQMWHAWGFSDKEVVTK